MHQQERGRDSCPPNSRAIRVGRFGWSFIYQPTETAPFSSSTWFYSWFCAQQPPRLCQLHLGPVMLFIWKKSYLNVHYRFVAATDVFLFGTHGTLETNVESSVVLVASPVRKSWNLLRLSGRLTAKTRNPNHQTPQSNKHQKRWEVQKDVSTLTSIMLLGKDSENTYLYNI